MSNEANYASGNVNQPIGLQQAQTRIAQLKAKLAQADYLIVYALDSWVGVLRPSVE